MTLFHVDSGWPCDLSSASWLTAVFGAQILDTCSASFCLSLSDLFYSPSWNGPCFARISLSSFRLMDRLKCCSIPRLALHCCALWLPPCGPSVIGPPGLCRSSCLSFGQSREPLFSVPPVPSKDSRLTTIFCIIQALATGAASDHD